MEEITSLYNGEVLLSFNPGNHQYHAIIKGRKYKVPSVTRALEILAKPGLISWAANSAVAVCQAAVAPGVEYAESYLEEVWKAAKRANRDIKSDAAKRGTDVHKQIETRCREAVAAGINLTLDGMPEFKPVEVERRVYSRRYRFSGTCDCIAEIDGELVLIDWKTSSRIYVDYLLQTAAYQWAYEEETGKRIDSRILVHITDNAFDPYWFPRKSYRPHLAAFLGLLQASNKLKTAEKDLKALENMRSL